MRLLVLAGGFGTRLKTAVADVPKTLAPINGIPFLQLQLGHWLDQGLREFVFLLHHQAEQIITFLQAHQDGILKNCQINWIIEPTPMDTGGAIAHAVKMLNLNDDFLMTNADTWLGGGVCELMQSVAPAMAIVNLGDVARYGEVRLDGGSCVVAFVEKNTQHSAGWINAGLYHLHAGLFKNWNGQPFSLERDLFTTLVKNRCLTAVPLQTDFIDIGVPDDYRRFCRWVEAAGQLPLCN
ncbi:MAG: NTP transferase domain-containing protein [Gammaproteobacteria bacterium]|nr:NTP transferase domain-containing protein [Gammaproteobacteria bacterium]MBU0788294.1 NTP transferase domain-containing protein [Gammaproteobacteria bacterium]MBU0815209.1 NTP transferase domain-containing protein [Gammaproteobacteria bacterium]MBU1785683.1 NTP transferase domain-containing protein [Gammaproteobacteria bacterium]